MSDQDTPLDILKARKELIELLDSFLTNLNSSDLRSRVKTLIPAFHILRQLGTSIIDEKSQLSARNRILAYFQKYPLTVLDSDELLVVSGITEYARRIRELRVEFGWPILGGRTVREMFEEGEWDYELLDISSMKPDEYLMLDSGQDREAALRWNIANTLRKQPLSVKDKIIQYFRQNVGKNVTIEELIYLANGKSEWARRVRELRTEEGWPIKTRLTGRPDLSVGVYVLEEDHQAESHDRKIEDIVRVKVLKRDKYSCRKCGWNHSQQIKGDPRHMLELHHLDHHADKGANTEENLITVCNVDHDYIHKKGFNRIQVLEWINDKL